MILATPPDSPPAGERRHQVRLRARGEDGDAWWAVRLSSGVLVAGAAAQFTASPSTVIGSWGTGVPADGSTVLYAYVTGQSTGVRITELYLDVDSREEPTFDPEILDGSGAPSVTISDTSQPIVRADNIDLDGLAARQYRYWVTSGATIVWDTGIVSGSSVNRQTSPLDNGSYTAHLQIWTTLGANTEYPSAEETLAFTVSVGVIPEPDDPVVSQQADTPFYDIEVCAPDVSDLDDDVGWVEIQRVDCPVGGYLATTGAVGSYASTPAPAGPGPTDLEVTVFAQRSDDWRPAADEVLASNYNSAGDERGWRFVLDADGDGGPERAGRPFITWSPDGQLPVITALADERAPVDAYGRVHVRVFIDVDNGAGGWTVVFESMDEDGIWQPIGEPVTGVGTTSVYYSAQDFEVGSQAGGTLNPFEGRFYSVQVRDGRTGPILASPDFTGHLAGTTSFEDDQGNVWTVHSPATIESPTSTVTLAMLGPLETDECATWIDYSLPRTGMGATCDHEPVSCCSYYRARTVGRIDGEIVVSAWSEDPDPDTFCLTWSDDEHLIRTTGPDGPMWAPVLGKFEWDVTRPFTAASGLMGSRFVTSAPPGARNLSMVAAVESEADLATLHDVLARPLVLISPSDAEEVWAAPVAETVKIIKIGRIRQVTADFIGTGPEPAPQLADVGA